jgi:hypothetical protein
MEIEKPEKVGTDNLGQNPKKNFPIFLKNS